MAWVQEEGEEHTLLTTLVVLGTLVVQTILAVLATLAVMFSNWFNKYHHLPWVKLSFPAELWKFKLI